MTPGGDGGAEQDGFDPPELVEPPAPPQVRAPLPDRDHDAAAEIADSGPDTAPMTAPGATVQDRPVFDIDSWMDAPPGTIPGLADAMLEDDLDRVFADDRFQEYDPVLPSGAEPGASVPAGEPVPGGEPVLAGVSPFGMPPDDAPVSADAGPVSARTRVLLIAGGIVVAVLALVAVFAAGRGMAGLTAGRPDADVRPSVRASAATLGIPTVLAAPGDRAWDRLAGGECLQGFTSAWASTFSVVDCAGTHTAQLLLRAPFDDARTAAYPGITAIEQRMAALCSATGVVDLARAGAASDLQVSYAFPATRAQWERGERDYWCFASRSSGAPISGSITAGAQQAVWTARSAPVVKPSPTPTKKK